eukprot:319238_1
MMGNENSKSETNETINTKHLLFNKGQAHLSIDHPYFDQLFYHKSFTLECCAYGIRSLSNPQPDTMMLFAQQAPHPNGGKNGALHFGIYHWKQIGMRFNQNDLGINLIEKQLLNKWNHYAFVYNANTKKREIYLNGKLIKYDISQENLHSTGIFMIGNSPWNLNDDWGGYIKQVRIWTSVRTARQIKHFYKFSVQNELSILEILNEYTMLLKNCDIFVHYFNNGYPVEIIELIVRYDGCGLFACFALTTDDENNDKYINNRNIYDIVQCIPAHMEGSLGFNKLKED